MVSQKNVQTVKEVSEQLKQYPVTGVIDMFKLPASQLHAIRIKLKGRAVIRMVKKRLIILALKEAGIKGSDALGEKLRGEPALIMTDMNPFKLARMIDENKSEAPAKGGDIAPRDISVNAGPTSLPPGPVIGELQKAKIPASIEGDKIHVKQDTVIAKEGEEISELLAGVMTKLGITPMEIGLDLLAAAEDGTVYEKEILFIPQEKYINDLVSAHQGAFNLAFNIGYPTKETIPFLLSRAHQEAFNLATEAGILTEETVRPLLARAAAQAQVLESRIGSNTPKEEPPSEEKTSGDDEEKTGETQEQPQEPKPPEEQNTPEDAGEEKSPKGEKE